MSAARRGLLMGLVLANLAFVQLTEAASFTWLGPLLTLTLLSPLLERWRGYRLYRAVWNLSVVGVFALLVRHVTVSGVEHLLSDGLLLAALCQVHLLNNIGPTQKPDLLIFNSFLVAVVTGFLSLDLGYSLVFLVYAPLLVLSMQVLALERLPGGPPPFSVILRSALPGAALALGLTLAVFLLFPRDFRRTGFLSRYVDLRPVGSALEVGFSDHVDLGREGGARAEERVVLRVRLLDGESSAVPAHFRGATLTRFDGVRWFPDRGFGMPPRIVRARARVRVEPSPELRGWRFAPGNARVLRAGAEPVLEIGDIRAEGPGDPRPLLLLPGDEAVAEARLLAKKIAATLPRGLRPAERAGRFADWLRTNRAEASPGDERRARSLSSFLRGEAPGHCELFASALAVMLRADRLPARLATGFRSSEWDEAGRTLTFRSRNAHAWVEVHDPRQGFVVVDPTPAAPVEAAGRGFLGGVGTAIARAWQAITSFDEEARHRALRMIGAAAGGVASFAARRPEVALALPMLLTVLFLLRRRRVALRRAVAVRDLLRAIRRAGLSLGPAETPRLLLARAGRLPLRPDRLAVLARATEGHEKTRYGAPVGPHGRG
jgi:hypothetical protein